jgi:hypothetical protein
MSRWLRAFFVAALALLAGLAPVASSLAAYRKIPRQLRPAGVGRVESMLRLIGSPILLPIERLALALLVRDGADVCTDPLRAVAR